MIKPLLWNNSGASLVFGCRLSCGQKWAEIRYAICPLLLHPTKQQVNSLHYCSWSQHAAERNRTPPSKCWKGAAKTKKRRKWGNVYVCGRLRVLVGPVFCLFPNVRLTFACKDDWTPCCDEYSPSEMLCFKDFSSAVTWVQPTGTVGDISIGTICEGAYGLWQNVSLRIRL